MLNYHAAAFLHSADYDNAKKRPEIPCLGRAGLRLQMDTMH